MSVSHSASSDASWEDAAFEDLCSLGERLFQVQALGQDLVDDVLAVAERIPDSAEDLSDMDPYLRTSLLTAVVHAQTAAVKRDLGRLLVEVERARQALRDVVDERPVWRGGPKHAVRWLVDNAKVPKADLEGLLDVSATTLRRWLDPSDQTEPSSEAAERAMAVAKIVNHLRHAMTPRGVVMWLEEPHPLLDDRPPVIELKDARSYQMLIHLAAGARSVGAT